MQSRPHSVFQQLKTPLPSSMLMWNASQPNLVNAKITLLHCVTQCMRINFLISWTCICQSSLLRRDLWRTETN